MLVCEGEKVIKIGGDENLYKEKVAAIISDEFMEWDGRRFKRDYQPRDELGNSYSESYRKDDKEIIFWVRMGEGGEPKVSIDGNINRLTGEFTYHSFLFKPKIFTIFDGSCKKSERAF